MAEFEMRTKFETDDQKKIVTVFKKVRDAIKLPFDKAVKKHKELSYEGGLRDKIVENYDESIRVEYENGPLQIYLSHGKNSKIFSVQFVYWKSDDDLIRDNGTTNEMFRKIILLKPLEIYGGILPPEDLLEELYYAKNLDIFVSGQHFKRWEYDVEKVKNNKKLLKEITEYLKKEKVLQKNGSIILERPRISGTKPIFKGISEIIEKNGIKRSGKIWNMYHKKE